MLYSNVPPPLALITMVPVAVTQFGCVIVGAFTVSGEHPEAACVSVSVAELLPALGSVSPTGTATVAVFTRLPEAAPEILQTAVKVAVPPTGMFTVALILPAPFAGPVAPPA